jgi:hypothetical protein
MLKISRSIQRVLFYGSIPFASIFVLYSLFYFIEDKNFADAALGDKTSTVIGQLDSERVHCFYLSDGDECISSAINRDLDKVILWLGNSQLHSVNQLKIKDNLASVRVAKALRPIGIDALTFSQPNANLQEHWILLEAIKRKLEIDLLILPVVFDDTREESIRHEIIQELSDFGLQERFRASAIGMRILAHYQNYQKGNALNNTIQDRSEKALTSWLDNYFSWESMRSKLRGTISLSLYKARNSLFSITPNTIRHKIPAAYESNMLALKQILVGSMRDKIQVLIYIPPLRSDIEPPYDTEEYATFKLEVASIAKSHSAKFVDLGDSLPNSVWGFTNSTNLVEGVQPDFMHFNGRGHDYLAEALLSIIQRLKL